MSEEFVKLHALIRIQGKTSSLQIVIHLFLLLFHRVYFILLTVSAQSVFQNIGLQFDFDLVVRVVCIVCMVLVHLNTLVTLSLFAATTVTVLCA